MAYLASGWVNGLDPATISTVTIDGLEAARGRAVAGDWRFDVTVIAREGRMYRFILASPPVKAGKRAKAGLRARSAHCRAANSLGPLRLKTVNVRSGDTPAGLAATMGAVKQPLALFRALNGLADGETPPTGGRVKLVAG